MNAVRIGLVVLALVLDALCIALIALTFLTQHLDPEGRIGVSIFLVVVVANIPPLAWALLPGRRREADRAAAVFD